MESELTPSSHKSGRIAFVCVFWGLFITGSIALLTICFCPQGIPYLGSKLELNLAYYLTYY